MILALLDFGIFVFRVDTVAAEEEADQERSKDLQNSGGEDARTVLEARHNLHGKETQAISLPTLTRVQLHVTQASVAVNR